MKALILLLALPIGASAGAVSAPVRAAPAALAGASPSAASVSFDGAGPLKPWLELPGTPFVRLGDKLIDTRAQGAPELLKSLTFPDERPVIGIFEPDSTHVLSAYSLGSFGVRGHSDALPQGRDRKALGGYSLFLRPNGSTIFKGSGGVPADITPAVERAILRFVGVRPARLTPAERMKRLWLRVLDWASVFG